MKKLIIIAIAVLSGFAAVTVVRNLFSHAPVPGVFAQGTTLEQAISRSKETNMPVLAFATADWCGPCQQFKKSTLVDPEVVSWIESNMIPVYIDVDKSDKDAIFLGVKSIPASYVLEGENIVASRAGYVKSSEYLEFLKNAVPGD